jgi:hypothetical protein
MHFNQKYDEEKGNQVGMMLDIYKLAAGVIFWLGLEEQYHKAAVRLMDVFVKNHKVYSDLGMLRDRSFNELGLSQTTADGSVGRPSLLACGSGVSRSY